MLNIVLFGPPGAGKGTQSEYLLEKYSLIHVSTGDLFRKNISEGTELGIKAKTYMDEGNLVPDAVVIGMVESKIKDNQDAIGFIFDGFPRTTQQAEKLDLILEEISAPINGMISLNVPDKELIKRLLLRGKTSGRTDDQDESKIHNRLNVYYNETKPVIDYYDSKGKYYPVEGVGEITEIFQSICSVVDTL